MRILNLNEYLTRDILSTIIFLAFLLSSIISPIGNVNSLIFFLPITFTFKYIKNNISIFILFLIIVFYLNIYFNADSFSFFYMFSYFLIPILFMLFTLSLSECDIKRILKLLLLLSVIYITYIFFKSLSSLDFLLVDRFHENKILLDVLNSRSSGLGRLIIFLMIFNFFYLKNKYLTIYLILLIVISGNRTSILIASLLFTLYYFKNKINFKSFKYILLLTPLLVLILTTRRSENLENYFTLNNRIFLWEKINILSNNTFFSLILGNGPQYDRFLIFDSLSNAYINILYSYGILGSLLFIYFLIKLYKKFIISIDDNFLIFTKASILYLLIRGIVENSFSVWGIDMIFYILLTSYIFKKNVQYN